MVHHRRGMISAYELQLPHYWQGFAHSGTKDIQEMQSFTSYLRNPDRPVVGVPAREETKLLDELRRKHPHDSEFLIEVQLYEEDKRKQEKAKEMQEQLAQEVAERNRIRGEKEEHAMDPPQVYSADGQPVGMFEGVRRWVSVHSPQALVKWDALVSRAMAAEQHRHVQVAQEKAEKLEAEIAEKSQRSDKRVATLRQAQKRELDARRRNRAIREQLFRERLDKFLCEDGNEDTSRRRGGGGATGIDRLRDISHPKKLTEKKILNLHASATQTTHIEAKRELMNVLSANARAKIQERQEAAAARQREIEEERQRHWETLRQAELRREREFEQRHLQLKDQKQLGLLSSTVGSVSSPSPHRTMSQVPLGQGLACGSMFTGHSQSQEPDRQAATDAAAHRPHVPIIRNFDVAAMEQKIAAASQRRAETMRERQVKALQYQQPAPHVVEDVSPRVVKKRLRNMHRGIHEHILRKEMIVDQRMREAAERVAAEEARNFYNRQQAAAEATTSPDRDRTPPRSIEAHRESMPPFQFPQSTERAMDVSTNEPPTVKRKSTLVLQQAEGKQQLAPVPSFAGSLRQQPTDREAMGIDQTGSNHDGSRDGNNDRDHWERVEKNLLAMEEDEDAKIEQVMRESEQKQEKSQIRRNKMKSQRATQFEESHAAQCRWGCRSKDEHLARVRSQAAEVFQKAQSAREKSLSEKERQVHIRCPAPPRERPTVHPEIILPSVRNAAFATEMSDEEELSQQRESAVQARLEELRKHKQAENESRKMSHSRTDKKFRRRIAKVEEERGVKRDMLDQQIEAKLLRSSQNYKQIVRRERQRVHNRNLLREKMFEEAEKSRDTTADGIARKNKKQLEEMECSIQHASLRKEMLVAAVSQRATERDTTLQEQARVARLTAEAEAEERLAQEIEQKSARAAQRYRIVQ